MLTDDGHLIDRRILLEAETLNDRGHEVIIVARQDGKAPEAARINRAKVIWIPHDLQFTGGLTAEFDLSQFGNVGCPHCTFQATSRMASARKTWHLGTLKQALRRKVDLGLNAWS